jgi:small subunit ribosomal protein S15e
MVELFPARQRRRFARNLKHKYQRFLLKVRKAKKECVEPGAKPNPVKTHLRDCIITPEMVGSVIAIHTGKVFSNVEIKVTIHFNLKYF